MYTHYINLYYIMICSESCMVGWDGPRLCSTLDLELNGRYAISAQGGRSKVSSLSVRLIIFLSIHIYIYIYIYMHAYTHIHYIILDYSI